MIKNRLATIGGVLTLLAVIFGAFAAHALKDKLDPNQLMSFKTGVQYQFFHGLGILISYILFQISNERRFIIAGNLFFYGVILFSGSIYILSLSPILSINLNKIAGPITPVGGILFIIGWIYLILGTLKLNHAD